MPSLFLVLALVIVLFSARPVIALDSAANDLQEFHFRRENVLGTSFDLTISASQEAQASRAEDEALTEIERLRRILSTYDSSSEISHINATNSPIIASAELIELLGFYERWMHQSNGAYNPQITRLSALWHEGEKSGDLPSSATLIELTKKLSEKSWSLDSIAKTVTRTNDQLLNLDSAGKGYIIGKAVEAMQKKVPEVRGIMLNIGGDIQVWGERMNRKNTWRVRVADPRQPAQNGKLITELLIENLSVSTSGDYARGFTIAGKHYSHILDPRSGQPAQGIASATVIATDSATGNALATTLCVMKPEEGLSLIAKTKGTECLIISTEGSPYRSAGFARFEEKSSASTIVPPKSNWPAGFGVNLELNLKTFPNAKRPYVAVWVEDAREKPIRTISLWAGKKRYLDSLTTWYGKAELNNDNSAGPVTRATRRAGNYTIEWDGTDDTGKPVPRGNYTIFLEVAREHGTHATKSVTINCDTQESKVVITGTPEFEDSPVVFGPLQKVP